MTLARERNTPSRDGTTFEYPVAASTRCWAGGLVCLDAAGNAKPGATALDLTAVGRCEETADNRDGIAGAVRVKVRRGVFQFANAGAADLVTLADVGQPCWIVDDETIAKTDGGGTRSQAGRVEDVDAAGVWVRI
jgi:hypothetical protein